MDQKGLADPDGVGEMVLARIGRIGVNQDAEAAMIEHQPRYQRREDILGKGDLKHRTIMRADLRVVPAAQPDHEALADPVAQLLRNLSCGGRVIVDMGMIAGDLRDGSRCGYRLELSHFSHPGRRQITIPEEATPREARVPIMGAKLTSNGRQTPAESVENDPKASIPFPGPGNSFSDEPPLNE